jgi:hypothetical protein
MNPDMTPHGMSSDISASPKKQNILKDTYRIMAIFDG